MRRTSKDYVACAFDASKAPKAEREFIATIINGEKRAFSLPQALDLHETLNRYPRTDGTEFQNAS